LLTAQYFPLQTAVIVFTVATELLHLGAKSAPHAIISISKCYSLSKNLETDISRPWKFAISGVSAILAPLLLGSSPCV